MKPFRLVRAAAFALVVSGGLAVTPAALADDAKAIEAEVDAMLTVGDKAPPLSVEKFLKGEPISGFEKGNVYAVEFWATWCGPCVASMPHLSELQGKYAAKGVRIVGVNIWEESGDKTYSEETLAKVSKFVGDKGDKMAYTVAFDGAAKNMDSSYMKAAGQNGIPAAFVVNQQGVIAWIGHPQQLDDVLEQVTTSKYDLAAATTKSRIAATKTVKGRILGTQLAALATDGKWNELTTAIGTLDEEQQQAQVQRTFGALIKKPETQAQAITFADKMSSGPCKDNAQALNSFAWTMVDPAGKIKQPDLAVAERIALRACELTDNEDGAILDTLARVYWLKGDKAKAIQTQQHAVDHAQPEMKPELERTLKEYTGK